MLVQVAKIISKWKCLATPSNFAGQNCFSRKLADCAEPENSAGTLLSQGNGKQAEVIQSFYLSKACNFTSFMNSRKTIIVRSLDSDQKTQICL